ncbi:MAG: hypothetical protein G01um101449_86 [Parcubacteria group bacterium Gr01-1014_49]|nr:MAG: hypothetical protein G01um101449_86 [Parcubacteria group bacterium Gr01-1014_49]
MCFSATASLVAGSALSAAGVATLSQAKTKKELPLASIPLIFGIQQLTDGVVWLSFGVEPVHTIAVYAYAVFSQVLWPAFLPFSILLVETDPTRRKALRLFSFIGLCVAAYFLYFISAGTTTAQIVNNCVAYYTPQPHMLTSLVLYVAATCGACLLSSHKILNIFGIALFISFIISGWFYVEAFSSVWCFFAAILSFIIYWHFRSRSAAAA